MKIIVPALVFCCALVAHAQAPSPTFAERADCILKVSAYIDASRLPGTKYNPAERFDVNLFQSSDKPYRWDFTLPDSPDQHYTNISGAFGSPDWKTQKKATIRATLRQFDTYEEEVTFRDLDLKPSGGRVPRFLDIKEPRSITTPSGITMTLLPLSSPMDMEAMNAAMNGNTGAIYIPIRVTPNSKEVGPLPDSPLFRKHKRLVTIKIDVTPRDFLVSYAANNTYRGIKVSVPNLETVTHLDELTFILRQRVDLQTVPIHIDVPIFRPTPVKVARKP